MFWWQQKRVARPPRESNPSEVPEGPGPYDTPPQEDLEALGPVVRQNHIAYVPVKEWARVPGVGTANLVYAPDFLLSPPAWFGGNAMLRQANSITIANPPVVVARPKTVLEGIGGITAGQIVHQPLLEVNINNGQSEVGE